MKKFVELIQRVHRERYMSVVRKLVTEKIPVAFLSTARLENAVATVNNIRSHGLNITNLITSATPTSISDPGLSVTPLDRISDIHPRPEYIFTATEIDARVAAKRAADSRIIHMGRITTDHIYETFMSHLVDLREVYESLIDDESRRAFYGYWLGNIAQRFDEFVYVDTTHYLTAGFFPEAGDIVIDAGACDGYTAAKFVSLGCKVYGFEMDKANFDLAKKLAESKGFVVENVGLGSYAHDMKYTHDANNIGSSHLDDSGTEIAKIIKLDTYVSDNNIPHVDFIKFDVEGAELDVLRGAAITIARWKPILAISAYHKWDDFWVLMNFVKSIRPDYEFALRHYTDTREDSPTGISEDTVQRLSDLGLEPDLRGNFEIVLLAR